MTTVLLVILLPLMGVQIFGLLLLAAITVREGMRLLKGHNDDER